jgi:hypothetical protein
MDPSVRENCRKCLEASIRQLEHISAQYGLLNPFFVASTNASTVMQGTSLISGKALSASSAKPFL